MKILSIDVGIKNLAFCLLDIDEKNYTIEKWNSINICDETTKHCCIENCKHNAKYIFKENMYCKSHAKKTSLGIPTPELQPNKIKKLKLKDLIIFADKYNINYEKPILKCNLYEKCLQQISEKYLNIIQNVKANDVDLINLGRNMTKQFNIIFSNINIDCVIIENQISPIANRMKTIQGMIAQYFIDKNVKLIKFISASNKLKNFTNEAVSSYNDRKKLGIKITKELLVTNKNLNKHIINFDKSNKKDDLADSFLQGLWYIKENSLI